MSAADPTKHPGTESTHNKLPHNYGNYRRSVSPCPYEARPDTSSEYEDREGKVLDIIFQVRAKVILLAGVVHQDDLLHQLHRRPVDD